MSIRTRGRAAALSSVLVWLVTVAAQDALPIASRRTASVAAAPFGIDRGLRPGSATRPVRKAVESVTRARATVRYLPGSIIVKFRAGTSATARAALIDMIEGRSAPARSGAPFDVVD